MSEQVTDRPRAIEQRCWTHEAREAVCRCPGCGHSFCRECVTEHESRLLCAACLASQARSSAGAHVQARPPVRVVLTLAGVILAWAIFFAAAESLLTLTERSEAAAWQTR